MAYNHGRKKENGGSGKKLKKRYCVNVVFRKSIIEEIRNYDRKVFNSDRRFYRRLNDVGEYIEDIAEQEQVIEVKTVVELLDEIENEALYRTFAYLGQVYPANRTVENAGLLHERNCSKNRLDRKSGL